VGSNTGALMKHAQHFHKPQLDALVRIVRETHVAGALAAITNFVSSAVPHNPIMDRLIHRNNQDFAAEAAALAWYIDAMIALDQFDNPLFKNFTEALGDRTLPSSSTFVEAILPVFHAFIISENLKVMGTWLSIWTSMDSWSRRGKKFLSQSYHGIAKETFEYQIISMDLILAPCPLYGETIAGLLTYRQDHWTRQMSHLRFLMDQLLMVQQICKLQQR
jgi:hypothetical protein